MGRLEFSPAQVCSSKLADFCPNSNAVFTSLLSLLREAKTCRQVAPIVGRPFGFESSAAGTAKSAESTSPREANTRRPGNKCANIYYQAKSGNITIVWTNEQAK